MRTLLFLTVLLAGCNRADLGKYELLGDLRVVAMPCDLPEVSPGAAVVITPLISDVNGAGRPLTYSVEACIDPGLDLGAEPSCAGRPDRVTLFTDVPVTGLAGPNYTGNGPAVNVAVPPTALVGRSARDQHNGVAYFVFYTLKDTGGVTLLTSLKKILVSTKTPKNTNPVLASLQVDGGTAAALPTKPAALTPVFTGDPAESFANVDPNGVSENYVEEIVTSWFVTDGELEENRTGGTEAAIWTPPVTAPSGRTVQVIGVSRDRRGGEAISTINF